MEQPEQPKIIVDSDWKSQAQAEKERLAAAEAAKAAPSESPGQEPASPFHELLRLLISQAMLFMGAFPDPQSGRAIVSLEMAKLHIDMLGWLEEKTRGNLSEEEAKVLSGTVNELRMEFVELSRYVAKAVQEGRMTPVSAGQRQGAPEQARPQPPTT
jgi:hypothetical protein